MKNKKSPIDPELYNKTHPVIKDCEIYQADSYEVIQKKQNALIGIGTLVLALTNRFSRRFKK